MNPALALRRLISERTRAALAEAKKKGTKLGGVTAKSVENQKAAAEQAEELRPVLAELAGLSLREQAAELNRRGVPTPAGGQWHAVTMKWVRSRLASTTFR